jgi:hypothetical protein
MNYERIDLTTNTCIRKSFEEIVMILLLIVYTFWFSFIQLSKIECIRHEL